MPDITEQHAGVSPAAGGPFEGVFTAGKPKKVARPARLSEARDAMTRRAAFAVDLLGALIYCA